MKKQKDPAVQNRSVAWHQQGQFIVELLVAVGILVILLPVLFSIIMATRESRPATTIRNKALASLQESYEAIRNIRERGWQEISANGTYHPVVTGGVWELAAGEETAGNLTRFVTIGDVYRNSAGAIVAQGNGTLDPSTKLVSSIVSWSEPFISSVTSAWYVTRHLFNEFFSHTSQEDFQNGVLTGTQITNTEGGEIQLNNNNKAKWCSPSLSSTAIDLPDGPPVAVAVSAGASVDQPNDVFVATAPETSSTIKMAYLTVTANEDTPSATLRGIFTLDAGQYSQQGLVPTGIGLDNTFKTNDIKYYKSAAGKMYALMTTNLPDREVVAVQVHDGTGDAFQDPVNHIYRYWSYYNTRIYNEAFHSPTANSPVTSGSGDNNGFQYYPTRAYSVNGSYAQDTNSGNGTNTSCASTNKDRHMFYEYGFSVPSGSSISGVAIQVVARSDSATGSPFMCVQLSWDGGISWTAPYTTGTLSSSVSTFLLGGAADTWGRTWSDADFSDENFRVRITNVASNTSRDFYLDYVGAKVYYNGIASVPNDQDPFGHGPRTLAVLGDRGYVASGGYLYVFDLSNIDTKSPGNSLDQVGCRIQMDGFDCRPGEGIDRKYSSGETGTTWSDRTYPAHTDCSDGGNIELYATNHIDGVTVGGNNYIFVAVGAGTNPEFEIVNATSVPDAASSPSISNPSCGRISGGNSGWKMIGSLDFNSQPQTEEAANSVYASDDGTRAFISSNGGIDGNNNGTPDSKQWYIINTSDKSSPAFLSGSPSTGATSGFYEATTAANLQLYPRRSLTVLNGERAVLVGQDGVSDGNNAEEYQVLKIDTEATPQYCGGVNYDQGFNDLTSVSEADGDNFVYMVANTMEKQLKIIEGGPDSGIFVPEGEFESPVFSVDSAAAFNRFHASVDLPSDTTVKMQVAVAPKSEGSCATAAYTYLGPSGDGFSTEGYYYPVGGNISGMIPFGTYGQYDNPNECFRYKVFFETANTDTTPRFFDMTVNYSP